jgi:branched-chain amino acid transport system permease protein
VFIQELLNAVLIGGIYASIGIGFSLVYGVMNLLNLAHGAVIMLAGYVTFWLFTAAGLDPFLSIPVTMAVFFAVGYGLQRFLINRILGASVFMSLILTYGIDLVIVNVVLLVWKTDLLAVTPAYAGASWAVAGLVISKIRLAIFAMSAALTALMVVFLDFTRIGSAIRAAALDREAAELVGVDTPHVYAVTYGLSSALAAASGSMLATIYTLTPTLDGVYLGKAFVVAVLGGLGNISGAVVGGLVLAFAESLGVVLLGPSYQEVIGFGIFLVVLVVRPYGLVGRRFYAEI